MLHEPEVNALRHQWTVEEVPAGLADRIARHALSQPQRVPFLARVRKSFAMPEDGGYAWKGAFAVAACVMVAIVVMNNTTAPQKATYKKPMTQLVEEMYFTY